MAEAPKVIASMDTKQRFNLGRPFLHAERLSFVLPSTGERMEFGAPLPFDYRPPRPKRILWYVMVKCWFWLLYWFVLYRF